MKTPLFLTALAAALLLAAPGIPQVQAQAGNDLLLPFPDESSATEIPSREGAAPDGRDEQKRRAIEMAETFIRRQQSETATSVPRRGEATLRVPSRPLPASHTALPVIAAANITPLAPVSGPQSELLPMPPEGDWGAPPLPSAGEEMLPVSGEPLPGETPDEEAVPRAALGSNPAFGDLSAQERRGPVFRVSGADAINLARTRGFKFSPAGGIGARDGLRTAASQFPHMLTSEVNGIQMTQARPPAAWNMDENSNTFFMFCDAAYKAVPLNNGWRIRGITLEGPNWRWVACPHSGAGTASFSVRLYSYRNAPSATSVRLMKLTLEGPIGAKDWREAFPWINGKGPQLPPVQPAPAADQALAASGEPVLPR
jgi:hypothetical protein